VLAASSAILFLGAIGAGIVQSFRTRGRPPPLSIAPDELARDLLDSGEYDAASIEYATALRLTPEGRDRGPLLVLHGRSLAGLGHAEEAVARYREALGAGFDRPQVRLLLATALIDLERFVEAIPEFRLGLAGKDDGGARNNLGYALERAGDRAAAAEEYRRAASLAPDLPSPHLNLGRVLLREGRTEESLAAFGTAARLAPDSALAHAQLGDTLWKLGRPDEAAAAYRAARNLAPDDAPLRDGLIKSLLAAGRNREAVAELRAVADAGTRDAALLNELAWRLATAPDPALRDPVEAVRMSLRSVEITANAHALDTLAAAYAAAGRYDEATATAKRAAAEAEQRGHAALASEIRNRLALFESGVPYTEGGAP
jgi:tetratricopeptide (TPR) repeat protein